MANHVPEPSGKRPYVTLRWKIILTMVVTAFLVLFLLQPMQHHSAAQSNNIVSSLPTITSAATQPTVVESHEVMPTAEPEPSTTAVLPAVNAIPAKSAPTWINIPDARISIDVSVLPMTESQRQVRYGVPPNVPNAFWVDTYDLPGSGSTDLALIMAHACDGLAVCKTIDWQFGRLSEAGLVKAGTDIFVTTQTGKVCYVADTNPVTYEKEQLADAVDVWGKAPRPGKLVLVSCYTGDIHEKNVVVIASMVACDS